MPWPRQPEDGLDVSLLARLRPPGWSNPRPNGRYDLLIVGGGAVGVAAAEHASSHGVRVALATDEPLGLDILAAALPRGVLLGAANQVGEIRRAALAAWPDARLGRLDFASLLEQLSVARQEAALRYSARALAQRGVDVHFGPLVFAGPSRLKVAGEALHFSRALLAPMPRTASPPIEGLDEIGYRTPETLGTLSELPRRLAIVGATSVACELAQAFRRLGSVVDLIVPEGCLLAEHDSAIGKILRRQFAADGIEIHEGWTCLRGQWTGAAKSLMIERAGQLKKLLIDEVLIAGKRRCELGWLRPEAGGIAADADGIQANRHLWTSGQRVLAIGPDASSDVLDREAIEGLARLAVDNALHWRQRSAADLLAPRWLRTDPLVCRLGLDHADGPHCGGLVGNVDHEIVQDSQSRGIVSHEFPLPAEAGAGSGIALFGGAAAATATAGLTSTAGFADGVVDQDAAGRATGGWLVLRVTHDSRRLVGATVVGPAARDLVAPLTALLSEGGAAQSGWKAGFRRPPLEAAVPGWLRQLAKAALAAALP